MNKRKLAVVALITSAIFYLSGCQTETSDIQAAPQLPSVTVANVVQERITEWDEFTGRVQAPETVDLRPRVSGYIDIVAFEEGAIVEAGEPLFFIDNGPFRAEVKRLEAELFDARSQLKLADTEFKRAEELFKRSAISQEMADNRFANMQGARAHFQAVEAALELARLQLSYTRVEAPITGRISNALVTKGNYVQAGETILSTLVSVENVHVYFDADEQTYLKYAQLAEQGARESSRNTPNPVFMGLATDNDYPYQGVIDFVDNQVNPATGTIRGRAVFENTNGRFIPGLFARIRLLGSASYDGVLIDDKAIGTDLNNKFVLVLDENNTVQYRPVTLGEKVQNLRIIKAGLNGDETIVVNGLQRVRPGSQVNPEITQMTDNQKIVALRAQQALIDGPMVASTKKANAVVGG